MECWLAPLWYTWGYFFTHGGRVDGCTPPLGSGCLQWYHIDGLRCYEQKGNTRYGHVSLHITCYGTYWRHAIWAVCKYYFRFKSILYVKTKTLFHSLKFLLAIFKHPYPVSAFYHCAGLLGAGWGPLCVCFVLGEGGVLLDEAVLVLRMTEGPSAVLVPSSELGVVG